VSSNQRLLYLARVSAAHLADFADWRFYAGDRWSASQSDAMPINLAAQDANVASAFSVVAIDGRYWLIQNAGTGDPDIYAYPAPDPWGPFDADQGILLYRVPGMGLDAADDYRIMYEARAEPALSTRKALVISYNVNSEAVTGACLSIYRLTNAFVQPRFISVPLSAFSAGEASVQNLVHAGGPAYPRITQLNPAQWFDALSYNDGCPPVPGVSSLTAQTGTRYIRLTWPSAGIGMKYRIYLRSGFAGYERVRTVSRPLVTLAGLTPKQTYYFKVVPVSVHKDAGPAGYLSVHLS
jgi:hypothetical protein